MEQNNDFNKFIKLYEKALSDDEAHAKQHIEEKYEFYGEMAEDGIASIGGYLKDPNKMVSVEYYVHSVSVAPENYMIGKDAVLLCRIEEDDGAFDYILGPYKPACSDRNKIKTINGIRHNSHLPEDYYIERIFTTYEKLDDLKQRLTDAAFYTEDTEYDTWTDLTNRSTKEKCTMSSFGYDPRY